ncbi:TetR/AcrR family transcriptional regulator [Kineosporia succinea]|uniref:AcrR family transcriptional regulator n=1 Tax=Kineosporia succinea TaxID=84632 RepID=A0ABT9NZJ2_9ACTN|nr:TetR/AcrR family transcriptional regulator [Kineosporia succinea]MDP9825853.1 AcrR family transcriptional regulator [Kineosporia succinea]
MTETEPTPRISTRRAATRRRLLAAASTVVAERGVNGASVESICEEAGFTRGAFYSNFESKEALLNALMEAKHQVLLDGIRAILDSEPTQDAPDVIDDLVGRVLAAYPLDRESRLVESEIGLYMIRNPEHAPALLTAMAPFRAELARLVLQGLDRAGRRLTVDVEDALNALISGYETGTTDLWISSASGRPEDPDVCRRTLTIIIKAISEPI